MRKALGLFIAERAVSSLPTATRCAGLASEGLGRIRDSIFIKLVQLRNSHHCFVSVLRRNLRSGGKFFAFGRDPLRWTCGQGNRRYGPRLFIKSTHEKADFVHKLLFRGARSAENSKRSAAALNLRRTGTVPLNGSQFFSTVSGAGASMSFEIHFPEQCQRGRGHRKHAGCRMTGEDIPDDMGM